LELELRAALPPSVGLKERLFGRPIASFRDIRYAEAARLTLDVCRPKAAVAAPVVVFFYGGGWRSGHKGLYRYVAKALTRRGYVAVVPDYRIYPEVHYPDFLDDGARAVRWVKDNFRRRSGENLSDGSLGRRPYCGDAVDRLNLARQGRARPRARSRRSDRNLGAVRLPAAQGRDANYHFGGADRAETQPIFRVGPGAPPALLLTGDRDDVVGAGNSTRLAERLRAAGNEATAVIYPRVGHYIIVAALAPFLRFRVPVLRDAEAFIARALATRRR